MTMSMTMDDACGAAVDLEGRCKGVPLPRNSTCSWKGLAEASPPRDTADWFKGCACYMAMNAAGP